MPICKQILDNQAASGMMEDEKKTETNEIMHSQTADENSIMSLSGSMLKMRERPSRTCMYCEISCVWTTIIATRDVITIG
jgi:predicted molibdopterin-dependent oxidoreductase YjgC